MLALVAACMRRQVRWELPTGFPAVALCDGGALVDEDETSGGSGGGQSDGVIPARDANPCMKLLTREYGYDWEERTFLFEFSTDDAGVVTHVCAIQVPSAPQSATCAADLVERTRFDPGITRGRYRFRFFID
ncbi:MAG: hypothetical protein JNJ54_32225 [Myxococcaceae bacterium]|nr:hypothetical protein [Myxococcaceae bacterium]